jgi:ABC-2 type transport system ATP-binding protein
MTILLTTHYLDEAEELCDQVAIIDKGNLLTAQPMSELMQQVASSYLWLDYEKEVELSDQDKLVLADYQPRSNKGGVCLKLGRHADGQSTFHMAYQAAAQRFGPPLDAGVRKENLEDVFLRLTGKQAGDES